jgi:hypothetical protein
MARPRERVPLEDGVKLDLNLLIRQANMRDEPVVVGTLTFGRRGAGDAADKGILALILSPDNSGLLMLSLGPLQQIIDLVAQPRHFGSRQWYARCPILGRRTSVLWMPPGARCFASRQAWSQVAYRSQFEASQYRAVSQAQKIRFRLGGEEFVPIFEDLVPPRPRGMHRSKYKAQLKRLEAYENKLNLYLEREI